MDEKKPIILCVDDEPNNLELLDAVLTPRGYQVAQAGSGKEALEKLNQQPIDLVLLDVMMPEINGFEVCRSIKGSEKFRTIPVVMITCLASKEERIKGIEAGAEDFISKPFDQEEVLARVKMLLKMKDLNDRLNQGYWNLNRLTTFGEESIKNFNPLYFSFLGAIDNIVNQIIRQAGDTTEKPRIVIVGLIGKEKKWEWYQYEAAFKELYRTRVELEAQKILKFPKGGSSRIAFFNEAKLKAPGIQPLIKRIEATIPVKVSNFIGYVSDAFCIFALNYSRSVTTYDTSVLKSLVMQSLFLKSLSNLIKETEDAFTYTIQALVRASEANDENSGRHVLRIGEYCVLLARKLKMTESFTRTIHLQAQMHDVGMIHIPPEIIKKPGELAADEWKAIKNHPLLGAGIVGDHPRLKMAKSLILTHHERWDGSGYPRGLKGDTIPIEGRILNIADQYDSLRRGRPYKTPYDHKKAVKILVEGDGRTKPDHFDPQVLGAFKETAPQFEEMYEKWKE